MGKSFDFEKSDVENGDVENSDVENSDVENGDDIGDGKKRSRESGIEIPYKYANKSWVLV